jgi:hypothetical protein
VNSGSGELAVAYPAVDYRSGIRAVRALADGAPAFVSAVEASSDLDPDAFASIAAQGNVREGLALAVGEAWPWEQVGYGSGEPGGIEVYVR